MRNDPARLPALALLALGTGALLLLANPGAWRIAPSAPEASPEPWAQVLESPDAVHLAEPARPQGARQ